MMTVMVVRVVRERLGRLESEPMCRLGIHSGGGDLPRICPQPHPELLAAAAVRVADGRQRREVVRLLAGDSQSALGFSLPTTSSSLSGSSVRAFPNTLPVAGVGQLLDVEADAVV
jgi:hypothetical protein